MRLGEALTTRSQLQTRLQQLRERLKASAVVQEGEKPPEDPVSLLQELRDALDQLESLIVRINRTNAQTRLRDGRTITEAIARRDVLGLRQVALRDLAGTVSEQRRRYGRSEIRLVAVLDAGALQQEYDTVSKERRELDVALQEANWATELVD